MDQQKAKVLIAVHRAHKEELAERRAREYRTMLLALLFFIGVTILMPLIRIQVHHFLSPAAKCIVTILLFLIADMLIYQQIKNYNCMCELQKAVASIDTALELFTPGAYGDAAIYPAEWKNSGTKRAGAVLSRAIVVAVFALVAMLSLWFRA